MDLYSYFFTSKDIPKIKKTATIPSNYLVVDNKIIAKELSSHIEIVEESRNLMDQGNIMTWEEFKKNHATKKK